MHCGQTSTTRIRGCANGHPDCRKIRLKLVVYKVPEEINRLRCRVAVLLACARTRIDKARWNSVQQLLQDEACRRGDPPPGVVSRLVREQAFLEATIAGDAEKDTAIMPHL